MSSASVRAGNLIRQWMEDAGLRTLAFCLSYVFNKVLRDLISANAFVDFSGGWTIWAMYTVGLRD